MKKNPMPKATKGDLSCERGVRPKPHEAQTAYALIDAGYDVCFIPNSDVLGLADCYINRTIFEIKAPEGKTTKCVERNLQKATNHQSKNIVIDSFRMKDIQDRSIQNYLVGLLRDRNHGIQRILFVNRKRKVIDINRLV